MSQIVQVVPLGDAKMLAKLRNMKFPSRSTGGWREGVRINFCEGSTQNHKSDRVVLVIKCYIVGEVGGKSLESLLL